ncbi:MAG: 4-hydroxy-tetrahydrodipicolinate reductase [Omnitrophica bacterium]|nr:4-hydroxy-tetrahydrodipicolinate reductase [Candidatus Omnitrophota bacterium]
MIKLGINGARGRMGQRIIALAKDDNNFKVAIGIEHKNHPDIGKVIDTVQIVSEASEIAICDCVIDFSSPAATLEYLPHIVEVKKCLVLGTTGFDSAGHNKIEEASRSIPIVFSPNMSVGVNLIFKLLGEAAKVLKGYNVTIKEAHHVHKKDAPSGTAKKIAEIINAQGFGLETANIEAIRKDEIVGNHKVVFESGVDKIELSHSAKTRDIFAQGALGAASWLVGKPAGLYSMNDVLFK